MYAHLYTTIIVHSSYMQRSELRVAAASAWATAAAAAVPTPVSRETIFAKQVARSTISYALGH